MKKVFKLMMVLGMAFSIASSAIGCSIDTGKKDESSEDTGWLDSLVGDDSSEDEENVTVTKFLTVATLSSDPNEYKTMDRWATAYMTLHKDTQITIQNNMTSMSIVANWKQAGNMPDVVWTAGDQHAYWSSLGYFADLNKFLTGDDENYFEDFYPSIMEATHYDDSDDGIWFMPRDYNQLTAFVNATLLQANGISIPEKSWTWADLETLCAQWREKRTAMKYYPIEMDYSWNPLSVTLMANFGASVYTDGVISANTENMSNCMNYMYDFINNKNYCTLSDGSFNGGFSPIKISVRPRLTTSVTARSEDKIICLPYPETKVYPGTTTATDNESGYVGVGCSGYAISASSSESQQSLAWDFLKFCMSETGYSVVGSLGTIVPARMSLQNSGSWTTYTDGLGNVIDATAFTMGSKATAISVNFASSIQPQNQASACTLLMNFFKELNYSTFNYATAVKTLTDSLSTYD